MNNLQMLEIRARTCVAHVGWLAPALALVMLAAPALGQHGQSAELPASMPAGTPVGTASNGLRGLVRTGLPVAPQELTLGAQAGYGLIEAVAPSEGLNRFAGTASVGLTPLPWLGVALQLDGRFDMHGDDGAGAHNTAVGDPRLFARVGHALSPSASLGAEASAWFPGQDAPSFEPGATTADLKALFAFTPQHSDFALLSAAGFRLDQSGASAPDVSRLRAGDRLALGLSDSHAVLLALGAAYRAAESVELFGELSADLLVGSKAPGFAQSPMRIALGGRYFLGPVQLELVATVSPSSRPGIAATDPLVPIEPRVMVLAGLRYALSFAEPAQDSFVPPDEPVKEPEPAPDVAPEATAATLAGVIRDDAGEPLPDARVVLNAQDGEPRETITDGEGRYEFTGVPLGPVTLEVSAIGFEQLSYPVEVAAGMEPAAAPSLVPKTGVGVLRGLTRSFGSEPLRANVDVRAGNKVVSSVQSDADGRFELELPPGRYRVTIRAEGYKSQNRNVTVSGNSVAILNFDLREDK